MQRFVTSLFLTTSALLMMPTLAAAQTLDGPATVRVPVSDLDLTSPGDRKSLDRRIRVAALKVCHGLIDTGILPDRCLGKATQRARAQRDQLVEQQNAPAKHDGAIPFPPVRQAMNHDCYQQAEGLVCGAVQSD